MKKFLFLALALTMVLACDKDDKGKGTSVGFDFTKGDYKNGDSVKSLESDGVTLTFGSTSTWYKDDQGVHVQAGTTFSISSLGTDKTIQRVAFTFGNNEEDLPITAFEGEMSNDVWTGAVKKVFFKVDGTTGHRTISRISVSLGNKESYNMTDVIDASYIGVTSTTSLQSWSDKQGTASPAYYCGKTAVDYANPDVIVLNKEKGGIVSTRSGGFVRHIEIKWRHTLIFDLDVLAYGDDYHYSDPSDLYNSSYAGTQLGTFKCSSGWSTIINVKGNYNYVGLRLQPDEDYTDSYNMVYIDKIEITWE